uniref:Uncharacterized protein n=1 Tax=Sparus aurata TaxID=8175 RepID=A0A671VFL9_SPAAU
MMKNHFTDLITSRTKVNKTPLRTAASEVHSIAVDLLVRNGANINAKDMPKMTALHRVAQRSHREVAELPLRYEADIDCLSKFHETPLDIAMDTSNTELMILATREAPVGLSPALLWFQWPCSLSLPDSHVANTSYHNTRI